MVVAASGVGLALRSSEIAFTVIRYGGAGYLLYLGAIQLRRHRHAQLLSLERGALSRWRLYCDGVLVDLLNPKTALFFLAFLSQFVDPARGPAAYQVGVLGGCFVLLAVLCDGGYVVVAGALGRRLRRSSRTQVYVGRATGGVYLELGALAVAL